MMTPKVHSASLADLDPRTLYAILRLRVDVFVVEQDCPYPELDGRDLEPDAIQFWCEDSGEILATLRLLRDAPADGSIRYRIGRVCTAEAARGSGLTSLLMRSALEVVGDHESVLDAQSHLTGMYAKFGFVADGPEFLEDGIPHTPMRRTV